MAPTTRRQASALASQQQAVSAPVTAAPPAASSTRRQTPGPSSVTQSTSDQQHTEAATANSNQSQSHDRGHSVDIDLTHSRSATPAPRLVPNVTIDLTDSSPEPEQPPNPLMLTTARMSIGGRRPVIVARVSTGGRGRPPATARMGIGGSNPLRRPHASTDGPSAIKRERISAAPQTVAESQAEEDDEDFPIIKELIEARKEERIADAANGSAVQAGIACPICLDDSGTIAKEGRQMMSTTCGHVFCSSCVKGLFLRGVKSAECPKCRKKLTPKQVHPIFL